MKISIVEEDWYRMYQLDLEKLNDKDSSEELAEKFLNWKMTDDHSQNRIYNSFKHRSDEAKPKMSSHL
jgi:hypothetical protein